ncbi:MAG TPA: CBS domain-containing protein [Chitinispirillaceae bacterium]|nr:CBS domain-containing protein [Chitinispirillaceae bacterium]
MKVNDVMTYGVDFVNPGDTVRDAAKKMRDKNEGAIPVFEGQEPVGLVTDRDITVRAIAEGKDPSSTKVSEVMTPEVIFCTEDMELEQAAHIMEYKKVRRLLVKDEQKHVTGMLSIGDIATSTPKEFTGEVLKEVTGVAYPER